MVQKVHSNKELAFSLIGDDSSISDLFNLVKTYDKEFNPNIPSVITDDGVPKIMYRGDINEIESFDRKNQDHFCLMVTSSVHYTHIIGTY